MARLHGALTQRAYRVQRNAEDREITILRVVPSSGVRELGRYFERFRDGTLSPSFRASERPIAIACFRLVTLPPLPPRPLRSVPSFMRRIVLSTRFPAAFPYRRVLFVLVAMICSSRVKRPELTSRGPLQVAFQIRARR